MKILIFTASFGNGHITASTALKEKLEAQGKKVKVYDIAKMTWGGKFLNFLFRISPLWGIEKSFEEKNKSTPSKGDIWLGNFFFEAGVQKILQHYNPDEIWCSVPLVTPTIRKNFGGKIFIQVTDYISPHLSWGWGNPDKIFCLDIESKKILTKNFPLLGEDTIEKKKFPLSEKIKRIKKISLSEKRDIKRRIQEKFFLPENFLQKKIFLLFFHHVLLGNEDQIIKKIIQHKFFSQYCLCIIAGENTKYFNQYKESKNIKIFSWIDDIENFYAIADAVGGKCGGAFISEVIYLELPLLVTGIFSGQEKGNKQYAEKYYAQKLLQV